MPTDRCDKDGNQLKLHSADFSMQQVDDAK